MLRPNLQAVKAARGKVIDNAMIGKLEGEEHDRSASVMLPGRPGGLLDSPRGQAGYVVIHEERVDDDDG